MTDWQSEVDAWWARRLGLPPAALRTGGTYLAPLLGHVGMMAVTGAGRPLGYGPAWTLPALRQVTADDPLLADSDLRPGGPLAAAATRVSTALGARPGAVIGPAWYGYVTADDLMAGRSPAVRPLSPADLPLLTRLHEQTPSAERDESGTTGPARVRLLRQGRPAGGRLPRRLARHADPGRAHPPPAPGPRPGPGRGRRGRPGGPGAPGGRPVPRLTGQRGIDRGGQADRVHALLRRAGHRPRGSAGPLTWPAGPGATATGSVRAGRAGGARSRRAACGPPAPGPPCRPWPRWR